jgi:hypothetical protein
MEIILAPGDNEVLLINQWMKEMGLDSFDDGIMNIYGD